MEHNAYGSYTSNKPSLPLHLRSECSIIKEREHFVAPVFRSAVVFCIIHFNMSFQILCLFSIPFVVSLYLTKRSEPKKGGSRQLPGPYQFPYIGRIHDLPVKYMVSRASDN